MAFLLISAVVFIIVAILVPKRLTRSEQYAVALFSIVLGLVTDIVLDLKYHVYGYFLPGVQFVGFIPSLTLFPTAGIVYMNFFPYDRGLSYKLLYTFYWSIFCLFFEFLSVQSGYFYHNGWKYWHSALTYPILLWVLVQHLKIYRWYTN
ncbi:hypothetical protein GMD78_05840 [Ornithinibacillus sp. L9]|uniref:Uncharacterized protein n=1 Tax=Ornithinibacillus caprae TaxID=2678566 RepID=A0A6N8FJI7_9BACI|nr:CBO0543 family protein [Ornithinibacillus caprae]MUK87919.1 hypothetical protein [Ornithinibacillus caprae]